MVNLRRTVAADASFLYEVLEQTMREYVVNTWGQWLEQDARKATAADAAAGVAEIVEVDGRPAGWLRVDRLVTHIQLEQLFLLAVYQGKGIGAYLVEELQFEAKLKHLPLRLRVLRVNPAKRLYERLGFRVISATDERFFMEYALP